MIVLQSMFSALLQVLMEICTLIDLSSELNRELCPLMLHKKDILHECSPEVIGKMPSLFKINVA